MTLTYQIVEYPPEAEIGYRAYGRAVDFWRCKDPELMISGPAETGKTRISLEKLDRLMCKYAGAQGAIVRKTRASMSGSVLQTWENKVLSTNSPVKAYGGSHAEWYQYPNGSRVFVGGMDNADKILSSERDFIYVNQAEELLLDDWEKLCTRATGRAGNAPYAQVFGDCNPGASTHWIKQRANAGRLAFFESRHEDNPVLFDPKTGEITGQGKRTMDVLDNLTGIRYKRLRLGLWAAAEGMVYDNYDPAIHLIDRFDIPKQWPRYRVIDFGYTNPFACQWWAEDGDGRLYLYRELYGTQRIVDDWAVDINELSEGEEITLSIADHDAEDRATLHRCGIWTVAAIKDVSPGIQAVQKRLRKAGDNKPRLYFFRDSLIKRDPLLVEKRHPCSTVEEFESYVWEEGKDGKPNKEQPVKKYDHGMDAMRYMVYCKDHEGELQDYGDVRLFA
jgi:PBSX family phage terminase large subunit